MRLKSFVAVAGACAAIFASAPWAAPGTATGPDPHRNAAGFFDLHICDWPDVPAFILALFSTTRFAEIERMEIVSPQGKVLGQLDTKRFRLVIERGKPEKRVFMSNFPYDASMPDGWYAINVTLKDGSRHTAKDYLYRAHLALPQRVQPAHESEDIAMPKELNWEPLAGARHYRVFIRDLWEGGKLIHESAVLSEPRLALPPGLLQAGGQYEWRIHARDVNEDPKLGDFNHGSLGRWYRFSVK